MKVCNKCKRELPIEKFCKCKKTSDGLQSWCKECNAAQQREAYALKSKEERQIIFDHDIERRRVRVAAGGCWCCSAPAEKGKKSCRRCLNRTAGSGKRLTRKRVANGLCRECGKREILASSRSYCAECLQGRRDYRQKLKLAAFMAYGGPICSCCGISAPEFLTIDHINRDGAAHRRTISTHDRFYIYGWLKRHRYPAGFQVLCFNCNCGREFNGGICPHKQAVAA